MQEVSAALPAAPAVAKQYPSVSASSPKAESPKIVTAIPPPPASPRHTPTRILTQSPELIQSPTTAIPETADLLADVPLSNSDEVPPVVATEDLVPDAAEDSPVLVNSEDAHHETSSNDGVLVSDAETEASEVVESHATEAEEAEKRVSIDAMLADLAEEKLATPEDATKEVL